jgi:hypothetical protein
MRSLTRYGATEAHLLKIPKKYLLQRYHSKLLQIKIIHFIKTRGEVEVYLHPILSPNCITASTCASSVKFPIQSASQFVLTNVGSDDHVTKNFARDRREGNRKGKKKTFSLERCWSRYGTRGPYTFQKSRSHQQILSVRRINEASTLLIKQNCGVKSEPHCYLALHARCMCTEIHSCMWGKKCSNYAKNIRRQITKFCHPGFVHPCMGLLSVATL